MKDTKLTNKGAEYIAARLEIALFKYCEFYKQVHNAAYFSFKYLDEDKIQQLKRRILDLDMSEHLDDEYLPIYNTVNSQVKNALLMLFDAFMEVLTDESGQSTDE